MSNDLSYSSIITDISYQFCVYSYTFIRNFKLEQACSIFLDTYTKSPEIEHACFIFLDTYTRFPEIEHACSNFFRHIYWIIRNKKRERKILRSRFRSFFVRFSERNGIYFLAIVYNRVPLSSVVISSNSGSIAFTKASNHVWYASIMNLGSTPAVRQ